ncbi:MAG: hypothetical protein FD138_3460 [Planctomycetota bacterium]|nr:MAG: hypothetical protein FD138_3460 [Planctomycetota bacterium]
MAVTATRINARSTPPGATQTTDAGHAAWPNSLTSSFDNLSSAGASALLSSANVESTTCRLVTISAIASLIRSTTPEPIDSPRRRLHSGAECTSAFDAIVRAMCGGSCLSAAGSGSKSSSPICKPCCSPPKKSANTISHATQSTTPNTNPPIATPSPFDRRECFASAIVPSKMPISPGTPNSGRPRTDSTSETIANLFQWRGAASSSSKRSEIGIGPTANVGRLTGNGRASLRSSNETRSTSLPPLRGVCRRPVEHSYEPQPRCVAPQSAHTAASSPARSST